MTSRSDTSDALPADTSATEALANAVEESRREYDKKVETMEEIDDKAMRSVRTAVILAGLVISAVGISDPSVVAATTVLPAVVGTLGIGTLTTSIVYGLGAYSATQYPTGIGPLHRNDVISGGYSHEEWLINVLDEYGEWSNETAEEISKSARYLQIVQFCLSFGIVALLTVASMVVMKRTYGIRPPITFVATVSSLLVVRTLIGKAD